MKNTISVFLLFTLLISLSCHNEKKKSNVHSLTDLEKREVNLFVDSLLASINNHEYELIEQSWDIERFKKRAGNLNKSEKDFFEYAFENQLRDNTLYQIIEIVNDLKHLKGKAYLSKIEYFNEHSEVTLALIFQTKRVDFIKYRIELVERTPKLTDLYFFKAGLWQTNSIKNMILLNSKYRADSKERRNVNMYFNESQRSLKNKDTLQALIYLYEIPNLDYMGNYLTLRKIDLAYFLHDSIFSEVLETEFETNKSLYFRYFYHNAYKDTLELQKVFKELENETGKGNIAVDSLKTLKYFWN